ncbi:hypothetical protein N7457_009003 [Penicillium paradoxum]|uniref:uncharacterized protein n=1 Tax=Penicillium paradoxum TaxID=176176 RepID=UPI0025482EC2|nr:uncharacterized protein N7457_009003 [Penicillium paradoxum]KAJ5774107.1 hypothetical protein N7457_009003 [Penicillium paradoxum]
MYIPHKRQEGQRNKDKIFIIAAVSILFAIAVGVSTYYLCRYLRQRQYEPKYLPGKYLKQKWKQWSPGKSSYGQVPNQTSNRPDTAYRGAAAPEMQTNEGVHRETSIRSIMTLPPYSFSPKPTERVIAREGERGGMDMVVEYPETAEEEETRREEQMDSLYQIRLQRRQELADREARRQERREARARGDTARLNLLNAETRAREQHRRAGTNSALSVTTATALAEHRSRERDRRISSVTYAAIGHVRHDGSRLRADSHNSDTQDSDSRPLLQSDAVSSTAPSINPSSDSRIESVGSSIMSESTGTELDVLTLAPTTTHGSSRPASQSDDGDLGTLNIPPPPDYDHLDWGDAPPYQSPVTEQNQFARQLPSIDRLPSIHVNLPSPGAVSPVTPTQSSFQNSSEGPPTPTGSTIGIRVVSAASTTTTNHAP